MQSREVWADAKASTSTEEQKNPNVKPTPAQLRYLKSGLDQPGGKLSLFDNNGQAIARNTIKSCIEHGWAERWFDNPTKPDWLVCRITEIGRKLAKSHS